MNSFKLTKNEAEALAQKYATPLEVISTKHIEMNYMLLKRRIPRLKIFYAIKANPAECILRKMINLGSCFDVASAGEINKLASMGVNGGRMIYANPVKSAEGLKAAARAGVAKFTFDSENEIDKIAEHVSKAEVLARIRIDCSDAAINLNIKFGAAKDEILHLLQYAESKNLNAAGICFHVGSQTRSARAYLEAFKTARRLIDEARENEICKKYLDIAGGLPAPALSGETDAALIMDEINGCIERDFQDVEIWGEPGRYICAGAVNILTSVIGRQIRNGRDWYYIDDGVYGSFSGILFDHWNYDLRTFKSGAETSATLAGPSCDSLDIVKKEMICPKLEVGDLLLAVNAGAYSTVSATTFNGFALPRTIEYYEKEKEMLI